MTVMPSCISAKLRYSATFTARVTGVGPFIYQWEHNGTIISGESGDTLIIRNLTTCDSGMYNCTVMDWYGGSGSSSASLNVTGMYS